MEDLRKTVKNLMRVTETLHLKLEKMDRQLAEMTREKKKEFVIPTTECWDDDDEPPFSLKFNLDERQIRRVRRRAASSCPACGKVGDCGTMTITEPVLANRPVTVTLSSKYQQSCTATWTMFIGIYNHEEDVEKNPDKYRTSQNGSAYTLTITNISHWRWLTVRVSLKATGQEIVCHQDKQFKVIQPGECGKLNASDTFIRKGRPVHLELKPRQVYRSYTLLFMKDADSQASPINNFSQPENMSREVVPFTYKLDSPMSDGIYLVKCYAEVNKYSTSLQFKDAVKPSDPILKKVEPEVNGCEQCIFVNISAEDEWFRIECNVSGGTEPKNVTISVGTRTRTSQRTSRHDVYYSDFHVDELRHRSEVKCEVLNPALDHPLNTTARLYIQKRPNSTEIKLNNIVAGENGTIECVSTDVRPASNLSLEVEGASCYPTQNVSKNSSVDTYNVTATCSFIANKTLHNKTVKCCLGEQSDSNCQTKQLNISFPPDQVKVQQAEFTNDGKKSNSTAFNCHVSSANPPCSARWEIPQEITDYSIHNFSKIVLYDGRDILSSIVLNVTRLNHGQQIRCLAVCGNFTVSSTNVSLNVTSAPLMKVFPGNMVTRREGEALTLNCTVDSIPKSRISWNLGGEILSDSSESARCDNYSKCYLTYDFENLANSQSGNYTCIADNDQFEPKKEIVMLKVIELDSLTGNGETLLKKTWFLPAVAGGGVAVLIIILIVVVFAVRRRQKTKKKNRKHFGKGERKIWFLPAVAGGGVVVLIVILIVVVFAVRRRQKTKKKSMEPNRDNDGQDAGEHMQGEIEEEHGGNMGGEVGTGTENVTYATVKKDNVRPSTSKDQKVSNDDFQESNECSAVSAKEQLQADNTYAQVLSRAERQKQSQKATTSGEKELVYLDIEFNKTSSGSKVKGGQQNDMERTEYVSIDFSKKAPTDS